MEYNNPNQPWFPPGYDPYKDMSDNERMVIGCVSVFGIISGVVAALLLCALFVGCTTTRYIPVTETHTEHHWHTDSVKERDSTHTERNTIIRELDSAAMARYGIQMQANQRAWLVLQREMENRLRELEHMTAQRDTVRDSIPTPYPVQVPVEKQLTWWQQARLHLANIVLILLAVACIVWAVRLYLKNRLPH